MVGVGGRSPSEGPERPDGALEIALPFVKAVPHVHRHEAGVKPQPEGIAQRPSEPAPGVQTEIAGGPEIAHVEFLAPESRRQEGPDLLPRPEIPEDVESN